MKQPKAQPQVLTPAEKRTRRSRRFSLRLEGWPTEITNPFYDDLLNRWPVEARLSDPISQLCTSAQFKEPKYLEICDRMQVLPALHRKQWEFVYIIRSLEHSGVLKPGARGLVFGVGKEKLPAIFIAQGCHVTATDLPMDEADGHWAGGDQHTTNVEDLFYPGIVTRGVFQKNCDFRPVNMNSIPADLGGYDFCWSACALEHLGSLKHGIDFIKNSINCLRPGGVALHTTEFNLGSATDTLEDGPSVAYRESDLVAFAQEMRAAGHKISLNLNPGDEPTDRLIDRDRDSDIHLRLYIRYKVLATSVGLCLQKSS